MADALRSGRSGATRGSSNLPFGTVVGFFIETRTLTSDYVGRTDGRGRDTSRSRKVRAAQSGVPGESQGDVGNGIDSPDWAFRATGVRATETIPDAAMRTG
jgi:hypothetical protein